ncbi:MAG TPA: hypothetical protein VK123_04605 [Candidatus Limnocylindrales bacterium]|nr:hypothetical protein [Candidatus Limnocylindrales bacterium]
MRIHDRLPPVALLGIAAVLALAGTSCETLSGAGKSGAQFAQYRQSLAESRATLDKAAQDGDLQAVGTSMTTIGSQFDAIESKGGDMNVMDRESMAIQIATGRRTMTEASRWISVNDADAVRSQVAELDPILTEVDVLLDRAVKSSVPATGSQ